ncbi:YbjN domain-containing protein [Boudabousia marimammalium]|uniref:YbjN domain-containing protein n=1 Tax=Boudabousia marimammalium TaxID=156892 RepID=A0A1Q5PS30_9ACTO|nr:YbjN domain-containing protein [Boudabousia marimammalium]OKL50343.1 hypothetical protein BM477_02885 [Boudabousia marimammalium]
MAWWNKPAAAVGPEPVTIQRMQQALESDGYTVGVHESGEYLHAGFNGFNTIFALENENKMLLVRSWLGSNLDASETRQSLTEWVNERHTQEYFPKTYLVEDEDGLQVYSEIYSPCEAGLTEDQLKMVMGVSLETIVSRLSDAQEFLGIQPESA